MDELYKTVEQYLDEYNQLHKAQMNLVIFRWVGIFHGLYQVLVNGLEFLRSFCSICTVVYVQDKSEI